MEVPYTNCEPVLEDEPPIGDYATCSEYVDTLSEINSTMRRDLPDCHCRVNFTVPEALRPPWYVYYRLGNYFQNHRRYLNSWDVNQLQGELGSFRSPSGECDPLETSNGLPIVPCGAIANSWFNGKVTSCMPSN